MQKDLVLTAPCTLDIRLYNFSTRQHLFHWTRSVITEQPRPHCGLLQDVGCHPGVSLSFNVNDFKLRLLTVNVALTAA